MKFRAFSVALARMQKARRQMLGMLMVGFLSTFGWAATETAAADSFQGKVVRVLDGDTVEVLTESFGKKNSKRIRLTGIDAPEKSQPFGEFCRKALADRVAGKMVRVAVRGTDRYQRTLGVIFVISQPRTPVAGSDANLGQISQGCAWHYKHYQKQQPAQERSQYSEAEKIARKARVGLWRDPTPQAPWEFRRQTRSYSKRKRSS